jgi:type II secretory pathway component PulM
MNMYWMRHATDLLVLMCGGLFTTTIGFAALWVRARERTTRAESLLEGLRMGGRSDSMSPALDAIAEEVERIGEGQRFITRIMSESASRADVARSRTPGTITPH